ncbi:MAG: hypothetical protein CSB47_03840 [Proteobacteria bacterium]|nr:MAG: hypothetical protein CSB47_03840 [Pseudomonadota bacterium]
MTHNTAHLSAFTGLCLMFTLLPVQADTATASQTVRLIIPKIAMIDVSNTHTPLQLTFDPITDAGDNFATATTTGFYDVTSNIPKLRLYGQTDIDLEDQYNLTLKVHEAAGHYAPLSTTPRKISTQSRQAQVEQPLTYKAAPAIPSKMISHGDIDVKIIYTLVEP